MSDSSKWLPALVQLGDFGGNWDEYLTAIYQIFETDFKHAKLTYGDRPIVYDSKNELNKEAVFWHITSTEDPKTKERIPDFRRCERISWIRPIIENHDNETVSSWKNRRGRETRVLLWIESLDFLVVLKETPKVMVLITTYYTNWEHTRRKLRKERDEYHQKQKPPS